MITLHDCGGRYVVVADECPGLKLFDRLLDRVAPVGNYYDNMRGDGQTALEYAKEACDRINSGAVKPTLCMFCGQSLGEVGNVYDTVYTGRPVHKVCLARRLSFDWGKGYVRGY